MSIPAFVKIFAIGDRNTALLFDDEVEITEKVDGSQFTFGMVDGVMTMRSKGAIVTQGDGNKMFNKATASVARICENIKLEDRVFFHCEYLQSPRHNILKYDREPTNNLALYGIRKNGDQFITEHSVLETWASVLGIDTVPLLYKGKLSDGIARHEFLKGLMENESYLGGPKMEGIVVKNYHQQLLLGGQLIPIICGKWVSEAFKEKHKVDWKSSNPSKMEQISAALKSTARWDKAVQRLREANVLLGTPQDIGPLIKSIRADIIEEEKEWIKDMLWKISEGGIMRTALGGFPEWYKEKLVADTFDNGVCNND